MSMRLRDRAPVNYRMLTLAPQRSTSPPLSMKTQFFNPDLSKHCAFPSLPFDHPGPGPSEVWKQRQQEQASKNKTSDENSPTVVINSDGDTQMADARPIITVPHCDQYHDLRPIQRPPGVPKRRHGIPGRPDGLSYGSPLRLWMHAAEKHEDNLAKGTNKSRSQVQAQSQTQAQPQSHLPTKTQSKAQPKTQSNSQAQIQSQAPAKPVKPKLYLNTIWHERRRRELEAEQESSSDDESMAGNNNPGPFTPTQQTYPSFEGYATQETKGDALVRDPGSPDNVFGWSNLSMSTSSDDDPFVETKSAPGSTASSPWGLGAIRNTGNENDPNRTISEAAEQSNSPRSPDFDRNNFQARVLGNKIPDWFNLSPGIRYFIVYELTRMGMSWVRIVCTLRLQPREVIDLLNFLGDEYRKIRTMKSIYRLSIGDQPLDLDDAWEQIPPLATDHISKQEIRNGKIFLIFAGLRKVAEKLDQYEGMAECQDYTIEFKHYQEEGWSLPKSYEMTCGPFASNIWGLWRERQLEQLPAYWEEPQKCAVEPESEAVNPQTNEQPVERSQPEVVLPSIERAEPEIVLPSIETALQQSQEPWKPNIDWSLFENVPRASFPGNPIPLTEYWRQQDGSRHKVQNNLPNHIQSQDSSHIHCQSQDRTQDQAQSNIQSSTVNNLYTQGGNRTENNIPNNGSNQSHNHSQHHAADYRIPKISPFWVDRDVHWQPMLPGIGAMPDPFENDQVMEVHGLPSADQQMGFFDGQMQLEANDTYHILGVTADAPIILDDDQDEDQAQLNDYSFIGAQPPYHNIHQGLGVSADAPITINDDAPRNDIPPEFFINTVVEGMDQCMRAGTQTCAQPVAPEYQWPVLEISSDEDGNPNRRGRRQQGTGCLLPLRPEPLTRPQPRMIYPPIMTFERPVAAQSHRQQGYVAQELVNDPVLNYQPPKVLSRDEQLVKSINDILKKYGKSVTAEQVLGNLELTPSPEPESEPEERRMPASPPPRYGDPDDDEWEPGHRRRRSPGRRIRRPRLPKSDDENDDDWQAPRRRAPRAHPRPRRPASSTTNATGGQQVMKRKRLATSEVPEDSEGPKRKRGRPRKNGDSVAPFSPVAAGGGAAAPPTHRQQKTKIIISQASSVEPDLPSQFNRKTGSNSSRRLQVDEDGNPIADSRKLGGTKRNAAAAIDDDEDEYSQEQQRLSNQPAKRRNTGTSSTNRRFVPIPSLERDSTMPPPPLPAASSQQSGIDNDSEREDDRRRRRSRSGTADLDAIFFSTTGQQLTRREVLALPNIQYMPGGSYGGGKWREKHTNVVWQMLNPITQAKKPWTSSSDTTNKKNKKSRSRTPASASASASASGSFSFSRPTVVAADDESHMGEVGFSNRDAGTAAPPRKGKHVEDLDQRQRQGQYQGQTQGRDAQLRHQVQGDADVRDDDHVQDDAQARDHDQPRGKGKHPMTHTPTRGKGKTILPSYTAVPTPAQDDDDDDDDEYHVSSDAHNSDDADEAYKPSNATSTSDDDADDESDDVPFHGSGKSVSKGKGKTTMTMTAYSASDSASADVGVSGSGGGRGKNSNYLEEAEQNLRRRGQAAKELDTDYEESGVDVSSDEGGAEGRMLSSADEEVEREEEEEEEEEEEW